MNTQSSNDPEAYENIDPEEISAKLILYVDNQGEIMYNCDWEPTQEGLIGMASIFYKLLVEDLSSEIFKEIKAECVSTNTEQDFMTIHNLIDVYASQQEEVKSESDDNVVVPPDRIMNI
tara:strand:+ start:1237 stop:1593 length:357 start_codon:yes stop_codon:yes gene_type:complete